MSTESFATYGVTAREVEVLAAVGERLTNAEIASRLYVSARTVETHIASLLRKLGAANRRELAEIWKTSTRAEPPRTEQLPPPLELLADPHVRGPVKGAQPTSRAVAARRAREAARCRCPG